MSSSRLLIAQSMVNILQGINMPNTSMAFYNLVQLGDIYNPTAFPIFAQVTFMQGKAHHAGSGGTQVGWRIEDEVTLKIMSGFDYGIEPNYSSDTATTNMLTAQDIVIPTILTHYQLPLPSNPTLAIPSVYSTLDEQADKGRISLYPNGHVYLLWEFYVVVKQQYNIQLVNP